MYWADEIAEKIGQNPQHVDDMKTLSGYPHIGSLRGPILHDVAYKALKEKNDQTISTYVFNDMDPIDGLSPDLLETHSQYFGYPLRLAPSPDEKFESFAHFFGEDFKRVLRTLGVSAEFLSSWDMYHDGKFNDVIITALDNAEKIQDIYKRISGSDKKKQGWYPLQVICPNCSKVGTTKVTSWNGKEVTYTCEKSLVEWAAGCGHSGTISPLNGNAKLAWKVDWPAHWKVLGVTLEGAGKDHASAGGSYDIAFEICKEIFHSDLPYKFPYEFFLYGGRKMSTSKGTGVKARDITNVLPADLVRFLLIRSNPRSAIDFDPDGMTIPDLFDEFDRCAHEYWENPQADLARAFHFSQVNDWYKKIVYLPRFRDVANVLQLNTTDPVKYFSQQKGSELTEIEQKILSERIVYSKIWIEKFAPETARFTVAQEIPREVSELSIEQKQFLKKAADLVNNITNPDELQTALYEAGKKNDLSGKQIFQSLYLALLGKPYGPKAAWFITSLDKSFVIERFKEVASYEHVQDQMEERKELEQKPEVAFEERPDLFTIHPEFKKQFPSVSVGIAIIKGVSIEKRNDELQTEIDVFLNSIQGLSTEKLGEYPEIQSYRRIYKETGIDWHSRRPSPEALLRRVATGKGLYSINTCVDAYNLVVMKHRVSIGAFDYDKLVFPTTLRFAKEGETIHLLGDKEPIAYKSGEVAYFDLLGGYNIDFNYRDAIRTSVTDNTKDLLINIEGVYEITPEQVQQSLHEAIEIITRYCGGTVEFQRMLGRIRK